MKLPNYWKRNIDPSDDDLDAYEETTEEDSDKFTEEFDGFIGELDTDQNLVNSQTKLKMI